jgi:hypothetical protein
MLEQYPCSKVIASSKAHTALGTTATYRATVIVPGGMDIALAMHPMMQIMPNVMLPVHQ